MIGMKIATYANVRVSNKARETEDIGETVKVAFRGGFVMGLCVGGFALLGLFLVYMIFGLGMAPGGGDGGKLCQPDRSEIRPLHHDALRLCPGLLHGRHVQPRRRRHLHQGC